MQYVRGGAALILQSCVGGIWDDGEQFDIMQETRAGMEMDPVWPGCAVMFTL